MNMEVVDQRQGDGNFINPKYDDISVIIINNSVIIVNSKYVIRTHLNDWMRQDAEWTPEEIEAAKYIVGRLNAQRR
jgi:hypothetical protein